MTERKREAGLVNHLPPADGAYRWRCEVCGYEWYEPVPADPGYDRARDASHRPALCVDCATSADGYNPGA